MIFSSSVSLNRIAEDFFYSLYIANLLEKILSVMERMNKNGSKLLSERNRNHAD